MEEIDSVGTVNFIRYFSSQAVDSSEKPGGRQELEGIKLLCSVSTNLAAPEEGILGFACKGLVISGIACQGRGDGDGACQSQRRRHGGKLWRERGCD